MELYAAEAAAIKKQVTNWLTHPDYELESTFGKSGQVGAVQFLAIAQRLKAKGYTALPQEDRLTVTTPEHVRFTLTSLAVIQAYCRDDVMLGKPFTPQIKDRATADAQVDLDDYGVRIKLRKETPMARDDAVVKSILAAWPTQRKAFRMIRRWSFEKDGVRIDMSVVRSTTTDKRGDFKWQRTFKDQDLMAAPSIYEVEVELVHQPGDTEESAMKRLIRGVGEVLRGVQKHSLLIRLSAKRKVLANYKELVGSDLFRGPAPRTLQKENFMPAKEPGIVNLREGFNVTDKADGLRALGFCDAKGELFLIDMSMTVYRTGLQNPECRLSLVDGEWVTQTNDSPPKPMQQFLIFDMFYDADKTEVSKLPFQPGAVLPDGKTLPPEESRFDHIKKWVGKWNKDAGPKIVAPGVTLHTKLQVGSKEFSFGSPGNDSIFRAAARVLNAARPYYTDGLIFTPNAEPLPEKAAGTFMNQFKWKPPKDNTVDFLVKTMKVTGSKTQDRVTTETKPTGELLSYKTLVLCVGGRTENPRDLVLNKGDLPREERGADARGKKGEYKPVPFTPMEFPDPMASMCNLEIERDADTGEEYVMTTHTKEPIQDNTIVEMAYDPAGVAGWRWIPLRVRMDKTERLQSGILGRTLNSEQVAEDVWNSIYDPITASMIKTGATEPTAEELAAFGAPKERDTAARSYFKRGRDKPVIDNAKAWGLKKFHNEWIKETILYPTGLSGDGKALVDLACGVAADLHKWRRLNTKFVLGIDYAAKNIMDVYDSAYKRYMKVLAESGSLERAGTMVFAIADTSKPLVKGDAGSTDQEKDILRSIFGKVTPVGPVPPFVEENAAARLKMGADCVSCMFAIHYFFESATKFNGFLKNLDDIMKVGGYFIGTTFDGDKVFNLLQGVEKGGAKTGMDGDSQLWRISKQYDEDAIQEGDAGFGLSVDVTFSTIGMEHREYLVPFKLLQEKMALIGCELLGQEELKALGLVNSTATFDVSWDMAKKKKNYVMSAAEKEFSFLNRWFVFKRKRQETLDMGAEAAASLENGQGAPVNNGRRSGRKGLATSNAAAIAAAATAVANGTAAANGEANIAPDRTIAVAPGPGSAARPYAAGEIFQFYQGAALKDSLGLQDAGAARWISPQAPFPIEDPEDKAVIYPTVEHFLAGMKVKLASSKPELAKTLFSREGTIHQKFLGERITETDGGTKLLPEDKDFELLRQETLAVRDAVRDPSLKKYKAVVDEAAWALQKDRVLEEALRQRWTRDARCRRILEAARDKGKTLLYFTPGTTMSNLGGMHRTTSGLIEGGNKVGKIFMQLAGFPN
jgi:hypothetical protein